MSFQSAYQAMNGPIGPSPALLEKTLSGTARRHRPLRLAAAAAAVILILCAAVPAAAARQQEGRGYAGIGGPALCRQQQIR